MKFGILSVFIVLEFVKNTKIIFSSLIDFLLVETFSW